MMKYILTTSSLLSALVICASPTFASYYNNYNNYYHRSTTAAAAAPIRQSLTELPRHVSPQGEKMFVFSPHLRMWAAYDNGGRRVAYGIANGGSNHCPDLGRACHTPTGSYRVHSKGSAECISSRFPLPRGGAPMPYCMHFKGGYAIHGSPYISNINGSHGCVRVKTEAARWLSSSFIRHGTKVVVLPY